MLTHKLNCHPKLLQKGTLSAMAKLICLISVLLILPGCASERGPEFLVIPASQYQAAFDAADEAIRVERMPPTLRDRRGGIIESEPRIAGSILEPWRNDNASFEQALENTISFQRRRVRVEFVPADFDASAADQDQALPGPDVVGIGEPMRDLTRYDGDLELRVWVYLERSYTFGVRRSAWTQSLRSQMQIISTETGEALQAELPLPPIRSWSDRGSIEPERGTPITPSVWSPISRDPAFERRLLEKIRKRLETVG